MACLTNINNGCEKKREMSPSHLNSGYKDTESAKVLLLNCWCVILTGEKTCWYVNNPFVWWAKVYTTLH